jgi:hypothetical protein
MATCCLFGAEMVTDVYTAAVSFQFWPIPARQSASGQNLQMLGAVPEIEERGANVR